MAYITVREYHPESGALLGNVTSLNFGRVAAGGHSKVKVIDVAFGDVSEVGNIKVGLVSSGGLIVNSNPTDVTSDQTSANGHFGIESSLDFMAAKASTPLVRHFAGQNVDVSSSNSNNVLVENRTTTISSYIFLDVEVDALSVGAGSGAYKIFFEYF